MQKPLLVISEPLTVTKSVIPDWNHRPYHSSGNVQPETESGYREGCCFNRLRAMGDILGRSESFSDFNLRTRTRRRPRRKRKTIQSSCGYDIFQPDIAGEQPAGLYASGLPFSNNVAKRNVMKQL